MNENGSTFFSSMNPGNASRQQTVHTYQVVVAIHRYQRETLMVGAVVAIGHWKKFRNWFEGFSTANESRNHFKSRTNR